jgi:hypothetical protein
MGEPHSVVFQFNIPAKKGKWRLVPPEVEREGQA